MDMSQDAGASAPVSMRHELSFSGKGGEYFRIWIVNLLLSIVTLGIYSAWAKVRREQYFHRNIQLDGSALEYHGNPISILKGRILVVVFMLLFNLSPHIMPTLTIVLVIVLVIATPWIICQAIKFRTWNTSWRGVRFGFQGTSWGIARAYYLNGLLVLLTLGLAAPWWLNRFQRYLVSNLRFGGQKFDSDAPVWSYYKPLLVLLGCIILGVIAIAVVAGVSVVASMAGAPPGTKPMPDPAQMIALMTSIFIFYAALYLIGGSYVRAGLSNALWNHSRVGSHQFESGFRTFPLLGLMLTNAIGLILTIGFFAPFAKVRNIRYRVQTLALQSEASLDGFVAEQEEHARSVGDQAAELLDIDLGF